MYKVIVQFKDLKDGAHLYKVGDEYPRKGVSPSEGRIEELATSNNKRGRALIEEVVEKAPEVEVVDVAEKEPEQKKETKKETKKRTAKK